MYVFPHHRRTWIVRIFDTGDSECFRLTPTGLMAIMMGLDVNAETAT
jgi:hypothetical protein